MRLIYLIFLVSTSLMALQEGVVLYDRPGFKGDAEVFFHSDPDLSDNLVGNDQAASIIVPEGMTIILYEHKNFKGQSVTLNRNHRNLSELGLAGKLSSIWIVAGSEAHQNRGVLLFSETDFHGSAERLTADDPDLRDNSTGNDRLRSLKIPPGWTVTLYEKSNFKGRSETLRQDDPDLSNNNLGLDRVSSLRISIGQGGQEAGVTLYSNSLFKGKSETLTGDDPDLSDNRIGNDSLSSIEIPPGYEVTLFEHRNYSGRSVILDQSVQNLDGLSPGNDKVSSIRVRRQEPENRQVLLFSGPDFSGHPVAITGDCASLSQSEIGNDNLCSIKIPRGFRVILFEHSGFKGRSEVLYANDDDLSNNHIGLRTSSIRLETISRRNQAPKIPEP